MKIYYNENLNYIPTLSSISIQTSVRRCFSKNVISLPDRVQIMGRDAKEKLGGREKKVRILGREGRSLPRLPPAASSHNIFPSRAAYYHLLLNIFTPGIGYLLICTFGTSLVSVLVSPVFRFRETLGYA